MFPAATNTRSVSAKAGIGLRLQHHQAVLEAAPDVAFMEVHTENYMGVGSRSVALRLFAVIFRSRCTASGSRWGAQTVWTLRISIVSNKSQSVSNLCWSPSISPGA
jgi:uncharacterized protein DUF692